MVESVIKLGLKGDQILKQKLNDIKKSKKEIEKPSGVSLFSKFADVFKRQQTPQPPPTNASDPSAKNQKKEESEYSKNLKQELQTARAQAASAIQTFNGTGLAQAGIVGLASVIPVAGTAVGQSLSYIIDAVAAFKDKMKQQAQIVADTASKNNDIFNKLQGNSFSSITNRKDINKTEQATIVNAIAGSMGNLTNEFQESLNKVFEKNGKAVDVNQAMSLGQGNFSALGNDKGFFMQQISSGFGGLPPSMKQKLTSQMFDMLTPEDLYEQKDAGIRSQLKRFDDLDRKQAQDYLGTNNKNLDTAYQIQQVMYQLDMSIAKGMGELIGKVEKISKSPDVNAAMVAEFKGAVSDLSSAIKGALFR